MKTYQFPVVVERDGSRWFAYCPPLREQGGATWGSTRQEALGNIDEVVRMVVASLIEHGDTLPEGFEDQAAGQAESQVDVTV